MIKLGLFVIACSWCFFACREKSPTEHAGMRYAPFGQLVLLDVQALHGGRELWIKGSGEAIARFITPPPTGGRGLYEHRYSFSLTKDQLRRLNTLLEKHHVLTMTTQKRPGVPDEARPQIFVKAGSRSHLVHKWANDKHPDFDPVYRALLQIAKAGRKGKKLLFAPWDRAWSPATFPSPKAMETTTIRGGLSPQVK